MKTFIKLLFTIFSFLLLSHLGWGQVTTIDFETDGSGYTPSATEGSGDTDVFNRSDPNIGGNSSFMWACEDLTLSNPNITLDQIDISGSISFTFSIDLLTRHYNDWDDSDELLITYSIDGGVYQNLMYVQMVPEGDANGATNEPAALDTDFDGNGDCGASTTLPALSIGTGSQGCDVSSSNFATFITSSIALSGNSTLDILLQFNGLTSADEGIYIDNIVITETSGSTDEVDWCNLQWPSSGNIRTGDSHTVYARAYEPGVTDVGSPGAGLSSWIGYSTVDNDPEANPGDWTWVSATFNGDQGNDDEFYAEIALSEGLPAGTYYYASRFQLNGGPYKYGGYNGGFWDGSTNVSGVLTVDVVDWCNVQSPADGTVTLGAGFDVYAQVLEDGITNAAGQGANVSAWIGYSSNDSDPSGGDWIWIAAAYNTDVGNNDEYILDLENEIGVAGTYYYASRFQVNSGPYAYGGFNTANNEGPWTNTYSSGTGNKSGQLIIKKAEPTNHPTSFSCGTTTATEIPLTWTDASSGVLPDGYLIKWSDVGYGDITAPIDGTAETDGAGVYNATQGDEAYTATGLNSNTTYYFKIWPFTNSGSQIDYKTDGTVEQTDCATTNVPVALLQWEFAGYSGDEATGVYSSKNSNISGTSPSGDVTRGAGLNATANANRFCANNWGQSDLAAAVSGNDYMEFTITPNSGYKMNLTSIVFNWQRSGTGPDAVTVRSNQDTYTADLGTFTTLGETGNDDLTINLTGFNDITTSVVFRIYGWSASGTGTGGFEGANEDLEIFGNVSLNNTPPTLTTTMPSSVTSLTASGGGEITATGGSNATVRGVCWDVSANPDPDTGDSHDEESGDFGTGVFSGRTLSGLSAETEYKVRAYATNSNGTGYGNVQLFRTLSVEPGSHTTTFSASASSATDIDLSFDAASTISDADGYIILQRQGADPTGTPADGQAYSVGNTIGDGTVSAIISNTGTTSVTISGLNGNTQYNYTIFPFNFDGTNNETYNYRTSPVVPSANATTFDLPEINVKQGTTTYIHDPAPADNPYDFGNVAWGSNSAVTFTIENTGTASLTITTPLTEGGSSDFAVTTQPASSIGGGLTSDFVITFTPTSIGTVTGYVEIDHNDATGNENPYRMYFTGEGVASNNSDIIINGSFTYTSDIDYTTYQGNPISNTSNSISVMKFDIRDGGTGTDDDNLPTILNDITFSSVAGIANIRDAALFDGNTHIANATSISGSDIVFTNLPAGNTEAADDGTKSLTLRVSFETTVTDNEKMSFTITDANVTAAGSNTSSTFGTFADVTSSLTGDRNRIEVTATTIAWETQPVDAKVNTNMTDFVVKAVDANGNTDLDENTCTVALTTTGTGFTSSSPYTFSTGLITVSDAQYSDIQTGITITATAQSCLGSTAIVSNPFNVSGVIPVNGDFRTTSSGTWNGTATYEEMVSGSWIDNSSQPGNSEANQVFIRNGHEITISSKSPHDVIIENGGKLTCTNPSTIQDLLLIEDGGIVESKNDLSIASGGTLEVQDGGTLIINDDNVTLNTSLWQGTENFYPNSNLYIYEMDAAETLFNGEVTTNEYNSYTAAFGNVYIDYINSDYGSPSPEWESILGTGADGLNFCHGNLEFLSAHGNIRYRLAKSGTDVTTEIGGNLIMGSGLGSSKAVELLTGNSDVNLTVNGDLIMNSAGILAFAASSSSINSSLTIKGNCTVSDGTFVINRTSTGTGPTLDVNLQGNLSVASTAVFKNSTSNSIINERVNFTGISVQQVDIASDVLHVPFIIKSGAEVQLVTDSLTIDDNSSVKVETGGTLNFGWADDGTTPLIIDLANSPSGTNTFTLEQGSTLKITHSEGISTTASTGNVQLSPSNITYNQTATFHYVGKENQVTGNGITTGSTGKQIIVDLLDNTIELGLTNSFGISDGTDINATGGRLDIRKGILRETSSEYLSGSGSITMTDGKYVVNRSSQDATDLIPRLIGNTFAYNLTGGSIELNSNVAYDGSSVYGQILRGARDYYSLTFSGGGDKKVSTAVTDIDGTVTIENDNTELDVESHEFSGTGNLTMTDISLFRMSRLNNTLPELSGIYTLTGGTVELYGTNNSQTHSIRGTDASKGSITYNNIEINADAANVNYQEANVVTGANFNVAGTMNVNSPACLKIGALYYIGGAGTFDLKSGAVLKYGSADGIVLSGASGNIQTGTRTFNTGASYGFTGNVSPQLPGNALPANVDSLFLEKTNSADTVILGTVQVNGDMILREGILKINADMNSPVICDNGNGAGNISIESGAVLEISPNKAITVKGSIMNTPGASGIVLKSDASGTGSLIQDNAVQATVERYITGNQWHYMFSPLSSVASSLFTDEGGNTNPNYYVYDEANKDYWTATTIYETSGWTNGPADLPADEGFIFNRIGLSDKLYVQTGGNMFVGQKDYTVSETVHSGSFLQEFIDAGGVQNWTYFDGWNLVGNPYASAIDWDLVTKSNIESGMYLYDDLSDNYQYYISGNSDSPYNSVGITVNNASSIIPSGQAVFVKATANGTFSLQNDDRVHNNQGFWKGNKELIPNLIRLNITQNDYFDETVIRTLPAESNVSEDHDAAYDAYKLFSWDNSKPQLYSSANGNSSIFAVNSIPEFSDQKIIPLGVYIGEAGTYSINMTENNFEKMHIWLEDKITDEDINLIVNPEYSFNYTAENNDNRFFLHFDLNSSPILNLEIPNQEVPVNDYYSYIIPEEVFTDNDFEDELTLTAALENGEELPAWLNFNSNLREFSGTPSETQSIDIRVTATDIFGAAVSDVFTLTVKSSSSVTDINSGIIHVFPNPAEDKLNIIFPDINGKAEVSIFDITGKKVLNIEAVNKSEVLDINLLTKGIYIIEIRYQNQIFKKKLIKE